jgi:HEAT repeat protein
MRITLLATLAGLLMGSGSIPSPVADQPTTVWNFFGPSEEDPADSLFRAARSALSAENYRNAAAQFKQLREKFASSKYTADSYYWEAYARYKTNSSEDLREARRLLTLQQDKYPKASTSSDASSLLARVNGQLARQGDTKAGEDVVAGAERIARGNDCSDDEDNVQIAALNALLQMDADRAIPILKKVLAKRGQCSEILRRKAVFLVSQKRTSETEDILLGAARNDPDEEVRGQAVFWLSQVGTERSVSALDSILRQSKDVELQKKALFAISQSNSDKGQATLREFAAQENANSEVREQAVFWLGQKRSADNIAFLKQLFGKTQDAELKDKIIFSIAQTRDDAATRWLVETAMNKGQDMEIRKKALFWAGQGGVAIPDLVALYDKVTEDEMKDQIIFALSQRREPAATDKMILIAKNDGNKELRKKAIFWLSQSKDPRASEFLLQIIDQ